MLSLINKIIHLKKTSQSSFKIIFCPSVLNGILSATEEKQFWNEERFMNVLISVALYSANESSRK